MVCLLDVEVRLVVSQDERHVLLERSLASEAKNQKLHAENNQQSKKITELDAAITELSLEYQVLQVRSVRSIELTATDRLWSRCNRIKSINADGNVMMMSMIVRNVVSHLALRNASITVGVVAISFVTTAQPKQRSSQHRQRNHNVFAINVTKTWALDCFLWCNYDLSPWLIDLIRKTLFVTENELWRTRLSLSVWRASAVWRIALFFPWRCMLLLPQYSYHRLVISYLARADAVLLLFSYFHLSAMCVFFVSLSLKHGRSSGSTDTTFGVFPLTFSCWIIRIFIFVSDRATFWFPLIENPKSRAWEFTEDSSD